MDPYELFSSVVFKGRQYPKMDNYLSGLDGSHFQDDLNLSDNEIPINVKSLRCICPNRFGNQCQDCSIIGEGPCDHGHLDECIQNPRRSKREGRVPRKRKPDEWDTDESEETNVRRLFKHRQRLLRRRKSASPESARKITGVVKSYSVVDGETDSSSSEAREVRLLRATLVPRVGLEHSSSFAIPNERNENIYWRVRRQGRETTPDYLLVDDSNRHMFNSIHCFDGQRLGLEENLKPEYRYLLERQINEESQLCMRCTGDDIHHANHPCKHGVDKVDMEKLFSFK